MPLDKDARRYADELFLESQDSILKSQREELTRVRQDYAARDMTRSGPYFMAQTQVLVRQIELLTQAKVDSLLSAYQKSDAILDGTVVQEITSEAKRFCEQFGHNGVQLLETEIKQTFGNQAPSNFATTIAAQVTSAVTGIVAKTVRRLSIMGSEATLAARKQAGSQDEQQSSTTAIPAVAQTKSKYEKPRLYYWKFCERFGEECYRTWRGELLASVVVFTFIYLISKGDDPLAWRNFEVAIISTALTLAAFAVFHLLRTPWLVHRHTISAEEPTDHRLFGAVGVAIMLGLCVGIYYATRYLELRPAPVVVKVSPPAAPQIGLLQRTLTQKQFDGIVDFLSTRDSQSITVTYVRCDREGRQYAINFRNALAKAGWNIAMAEVDDASYGVYIETMNAHTPSGYTKATFLLRGAFKEAGIEGVGDSMGGNGGPESTRLVVGPKRD